MRPLNILTYMASAAAVNAAAEPAPTASPCPQGVGADKSILEAPSWKRPFEKAFGGKHDRHHQIVERQLAERALGDAANVQTRWNKCLDVRDGKFASGNVPQIWDCVQNHPNQVWKVSGNNIRANNGMCLDIPSGAVYAGAPVQLWACDNNNRNQWFEVAGPSIRRKGTNYCLDVRDGRYDNGAALQIWPCDWNAGGNQVFTMGALPAQAQAAGSASSFLNYATISIDRFSQLHPECAPFKDAFVAAAAANQLVPTLLAALAETESSCNPNVNQFGLMQWMDDGAWRAYSTPGANRMNPTDATWATARYMRALLNENQQNLDNALRGYNGPVWQGGNPGYQNEVRTWMSGGSMW